jgi:hypothetical protein
MIPFRLYAVLVFAMFVAAVVVPKTALRIGFGLVTLAMVVVPVVLLLFLSSRSSVHWG